MPPTCLLNAFPYKGPGFDVYLNKRGNAANPCLTVVHFPHSYTTDWTHKTETCREHPWPFPRVVCRDRSLPRPRYADASPSCSSFLINNTCSLSSRNWVHLDNKVLLELAFWIWHFAKRCFHSMQRHGFLEGSFRTITPMNKTPKYQLTEATSNQNCSYQFPWVEVKLPQHTTEQFSF